MSDLDGNYRWVVCRTALHQEASRTSQYEIRQLFGNESYEVVTNTDQAGKETHTTKFLREGAIVDSSGEFCGEFTDRGLARIEAARLQKLLEVMES